MGKLQKYIIIYLIIFAIVALAAWLIPSLSSDIKTGVRFFVVPDNLTASIEGNSKDISYGSVVGYKPGTYNITISKDGFDSQSISNVIVEENKINNVCIQLRANNDKGREEFSKTKDLQARLEGIFGCMVTNGGQQIEEDYPFINKLPVVDKYFSANACKESADVNSKYIICVKLVINNSFHKKRAVQILESNGIDVNATKIRYLDFNYNT